LPTVSEGGVLPKSILYVRPDTTVNASGLNTASASRCSARIWNVPVAISTVVGAGTAVVGAFGTEAKIFRRGGATVEASNSHDDYFVRDLVAEGLAIVIEQQIAEAGNN
jgi:hypothetical protein